MLLGTLLTLLIIVCVCLIAVILLQRSEGGALGMGGGGGGFLSTRGTADLLTRTTQVLGFLFFVLCLTITVVTGRTQGSGSVVDVAPIGKVDPNSLKPGAPAPADPSGGFQAPLPSIGQPAPAPSPNAPPSPDFKTQPANPLENLAPTR